MGNYEVHLRGLHTIYGKNEPLIVVDGLPGASLLTLDPQDIASIQVMRDGASAAIYGTQGASGVILIQTKKGKTDQFNVRYQAYMATEMVDKFNEMFNTGEYLAIVGNSGSDFFNPALNHGSSTEWGKEISQSSFSQAHNLSFSGKALNTYYRLGLNYRDVGGVAIHSGFYQLNGVLSLHHRSWKDRLLIQANLASTYRQFEAANELAFQQSAIYNPTAPVRSSNLSQFDNYFQEFRFFYFNPVALLEQNKNEGEQKVNTLNLNTELRVLPNIYIGGHIAWQQQEGKRGEYSPPTDFWRGQQTNGWTSLNEELNNTKYARGFLRYENQLGRHHLNLETGIFYQEYNLENRLIANSNFVTENFSYRNLDFEKLLESAGDEEPVVSKSKIKLPAYNLNLSYDYDQLIYVRVNLRREGSTRFGENQKWALFPSFSAGLYLNRFIKASWLDYLRLRGSFGIAGNLPPQGYYATQTLGEGPPFFYNGEYIESMVYNNIPNPNLKWEERREIDFGLDFGILKGNVQVAIDYFSSRVEDLLFEYLVDVPPNLFHTKAENYGVISNKGFELGLSATLLKEEKITWNLGFNFGTINTELVSLSPPGGTDLGSLLLRNTGFFTSATTLLEEGKPIGDFFGPVFEGIADGEWQFEDINGDGFFCGCSDDFAPIGNGLPKFSFGLSNRFAFGKFDLNIFLRGVSGHKLLNSYKMGFGVPQIIRSYNVPRSAFESPLRELEEFSKFSDFWIEKASYIRLDNITLGYTFGTKEGQLISRLRLYLTAQNLFTITKYSGIDPEVRLSNTSTGSFKNRGLTPGFDPASLYFGTKGFVFGLQLGLR